MSLIPTIGIEMHCEMKSNSKVFSTAKNTFSRHSNTHVSAMDIALPGVLPVLNKECVKKAILMSSILNCEIPKYVYFDRKNYYYPDLPKGYQITQNHAPIGVNGRITIPHKDGTLEVKIHDIHLEEDTAQLDHLMEETLINYNRAGVPLLELVTEPIFHSKEEVLSFLEYIRKVYQYTDISDADVRKGQIRCDVNVSIGEESGPLGTRVEIKNVNSISNVILAIETEINRQMSLIENNEKDSILQETRRFDEDTKTTKRMREKVDAIDYKYFIEPNIPKIKLDSKWIEEIKNSIPELPLQRIIRYKTLGLGAEDINIITKERSISDYYDKCLMLGSDAFKVANWITGPILSYLKKTEIKISEISLTEKELHLLLLKIEDKTISTKQAKEIANIVLNEKKSVEECLKQVSPQVSDDKFLEDYVKKIIEENPNQVEAYRSGRTNLFNFFVGLVMKETKGNANPTLTKEIIAKYLN